MVFKQFRPLIKNQTNNNIKELFTDNGKEYINKTFKVYIDAYSIIHRKTPIYTKEPNGLIEHINLTLLNKVRAILLYSGLPNYLQGEAILVVYYIYNRTPYSAIDLKTPYEAYNSIKPNISNIKIWGSIAYYQDNKPKEKLAPRKQKAILIGYSDYNHYKLFLNNKTIQSRDATILENQFIDTKKSDYPITIPINIGENKDKKQKAIYSPKQTRASYKKLLEADPSHKIEVQIPNIANNAIYTIEDTMLNNIITPINRSNLAFILCMSTTEPNMFK